MYTVNDGLRSIIGVATLEEANAYIDKYLEIEYELSVIQHQISNTELTFDKAAYIESQRQYFDIIELVTQEEVFAALNAELLAEKEKLLNMECLS